MTLRVGIIGVGWGAHVQVPGFRAAKGFEPVALCARTPDRLERVATKLGIEQTSTDWQSFVTRDELDIISVATPTVLHHEMTIAALAAGKAVLCEKPLAGDLDAARQMVRAAADSGLPTACCFENRWNPDWLAVADRVRSGFLGSQYLARVSRSASYWHPSHPLQAHWMYDREQGAAIWPACWYTIWTFCAVCWVARCRCARRSAPATRSANCPTVARWPSPPTTPRRC